jgi:beta-lactamase class A
VKKKQNHLPVVLSWIISIVVAIAILLAGIGTGFIAPPAWAANIPILDRLIPSPIADLSDLTPQIDSYLQKYGSNVTAAVYIPQSKHYYAYNPGKTTIMASTAKVAILCDLLQTHENQKQLLTDEEDSDATSMIEDSDNDAAMHLYDELGGAAHVNQYLKSIGVSGIVMNDHFGYSTTTPIGILNLLTKLQQGKILTSDGRNYVMHLMENISSSQRYGVGQTAPSNSTYAMKAGWVTAPDNTWTDGSVGIMITPATTYMISVYVQKQSTKEDGFAVLNTICGAVAERLGSHSE